MKAVKILLGVVLAVGLGFLFVRVFVAELGGSRDAGPPAVIFAAPSGYVVVEASPATRAAAASRLRAELAAQPTTRQLGIHFATAGYELYWLIDRGVSPLALTERSAGPGGTRVETVWPGDVDRRLAWAAEHGDLAAPDMPAGEAKNLYH